VAPGALHEDLRRDDATIGPSDRRFGLTLGGIVALIAVIKSLERSGWGPVWAMPAVALIGCALLRPSLLSGLNAIWLKFGLVLHRIISPIVMAVLFYGTIVPIGLLMRLVGKDPLRLKLDREAESYWLARSDARSPSEAMRQQF
jgi:hypothetical protein